MLTYSGEGQRPASKNHVSCDSPSPRSRRPWSSRSPHPTSPRGRSPAAPRRGRRPRTPAACCARCARNATSGASSCSSSRRPDLRRRAPAAEAAVVRARAAEAADRLGRLLPPLRAAARQPRRPRDRPSRRRRQRDPRANRQRRQPQGDGRRRGPRAVRLVPLAAFRSRRSPTATCRSSRPGYVDGAGVRYRQESFAVRGLGTGSLVSFVSVTASAGAQPAVVRLVHSTRRKGRTTQAAPRGHRVPVHGRAGRDADRLRRVDLRPTCGR